MKLVRCFWILFLLFDACIDPYDLSIANDQSAIVVDGLITDQPGPYWVKLSRTLPLNDQLDATSWVTGASIAIYDETGLKEILEEDSPGQYRTQQLQGVVGASYYITITTKDGFKYQSQPEKLLPVGDFSNLRFQYVKNQLNTSEISSTNGFNILLDATLLPEQNGLVRWRWTGTYEIKTYPELAKKFVAGKNGVLTLVPDPPLCSGYAVQKSVFQKIGDCTCCNCWVNQFSDPPILSEKKFINGTVIKDLTIAFIEANRRTFYNKYYLEVEQMSTSQVAYDFWSKVKTQKENGSNLFQTPGAVTSGNVAAISSNAPAIIGIFGASSIKKKAIMIYREDVLVPLPPIDTILFSCNQVYRNSTTTKPPFW